ncbi:MAG: redox-sensing transcriptional repressor Rex [Oscillospiraceae bacterium]|jgi:redox-sensing transcriptional repressor|nr:redox-sensing transcriptional repressor Rex [Oscillospiraceae bacterium]
MEKKNDVSMAVVKRLPKYYRFLVELEKQGVLKVSSNTLAEMMVATASQVRQDFSCFGGFGQQGYGYNVSQLKREIETVLGLNKLVRYNAILVGAGNLGRAISWHMDFDDFAITPVAVFDKNPEYIGKKMKTLTIQSINNLEKLCSSININLAVLCLPEEEAEEMVDFLYNKCHIKNYWNFTGFDISNKYKDTFSENVYLGDSLMTLCYRIRHGGKKPPEEI